jgi:hypothetical protein
LVIVLPLAVPDNILHWAASQAAASLTALVKPGYSNVLDVVSSSTNLSSLSDYIKESFNKVVARINTIMTDIFYQAHALITAPNADLENPMFSASTLGVIQRCLPSILSGSSA